MTTAPRAARPVLPRQHDQPPATADRLNRRIATVKRAVALAALRRRHRTLLALRWLLVPVLSRRGAEPSGLPRGRWSHPAGGLLGGDAAARGDQVRLSLLLRAQKRDPPVATGGAHRTTDGPT